MKKAELIFVPFPSIGHLVSTLEFAKCLIDRDDRILIAVLVMKLPLFPYVDVYAKSVAAAQPRIRLVELPQAQGFLSLVMDIPTHQKEFEESSDSELLIPGFVNPVPLSVLPLSLFTKHKDGYSTYIKMAQKFKNVNGILVNTIFELEQYMLNSFSGGLNPPVYTVGPVLDLQLQGQPNPNLDEEQCRKILKWLDDQPESSVVFLCFGSRGSFGPAQVKELAIGLEQSEHKFLWSLRLSPPNNEVPGNEDDDIFPEGFLERIRGRGMICGWAPQVEILAHKAIGGFVSHCGWNSILESLWYGVPIVTWPLYAEQQLNAFGMVKE